MAARVTHGGKFSHIFHLNPQLLATFLYKNVEKAFSFRGALPPDHPPGAPGAPGALPLDPDGGSAPRPPFRLALCALAMVPPLANPGSATGLQSQ